MYPVGDRLSVDALHPLSGALHFAHSLSSLNLLRHKTDPPGKFTFALSLATHLSVSCSAISLYFDSTKQRELQAEILKNYYDAYFVRVTRKQLKTIFFSKKYNYVTENRAMEDLRTSSRPVSDLIKA